MIGATQPNRFPTDTDEPQRLRSIQRAQFQVESLQGKVLDDSQRRKLMRAYATLGSLLSSVSSPETGLRDLIRATWLSSTEAPQRVAELIAKFKAEDAAKKPIFELVRELFDEPNQAAIVKQRDLDYSKFLKATAEARKGSAQGTGGKFPLPPYTPDAELGEALRVYARDVLLSEQRSDNKLAGQLQALIDAALFAIRSFERGLKYSEASDRSHDIASYRAWVLAHRAATFTMLYWFARSTFEKPDSARVREDADKPMLDWLFRQSDDGFERALEENPSYLWCRQFRAFLLALRGEPATRNGPSDFFRARRLLHLATHEQPGAASQTHEHSNTGSILRHLAMLYSYDAVNDEAKSETEKITAAEHSMDAAIGSAHADPDEFLGVYFGVASHWFLARKSKLSPEDQAAYQKTLQASLDSARVRARNALSQALTALAGLQDLQYLFDKTDSRDGIDYHKYLGTFQSDWESRAFFARDPVSTFAKDEKLVDDRRRAHLALLSSDEAMSLVKIFRDNYENEKR